MSACIHTFMHTYWCKYVYIYTYRNTNIHMPVLLHIYLHTCSYMIDTSIQTGRKTYFLLTHTWLQTYIISESSLFRISGYLYFQDLQIFIFLDVTKFQQYQNSWKYGYPEIWKFQLFELCVCLSVCVSVNEWFARYVLIYIYICMFILSRFDYI